MTLLESKPEPLRSEMVTSIVSLVRTVASWPTPKRGKDEIIAYVAERYTCTAAEVETALSETGVSLG